MACSWLQFARISAIAGGGETLLPIMRTCALPDGRMHAQRFTIVIDGDVWFAAKCHCQGGTCTAAAGEIVDNQLMAEVER